MPIALIALIEKLSFQALSTTALLRSKANWWLGLQLVQQRHRCNCLSKWLWRYADGGGTFNGAEVLFLNIVSFDNVHKHGHGFEHKIVYISILWAAVTFDGIWGRSCFCIASGDSFGQCGCVHVFVVDLPVLQGFISNIALCIKIFFLSTDMQSRQLQSYWKLKKSACFKKCEWGVQGEAIINHSASSYISCINFRFIVSDDCIKEFPA